MSGPLRPPPGGKAAPQLYTIAHVDLAFSAVPGRPAFAALDTIIIDSTRFNCAFLSRGRGVPRSGDSKHRPGDIAMTFKALLATKTDEKISTSVVEMTELDLMPGDVTVAVDYSTVNYKDAIAISGRGEIIRQFPLIPGIDLAGTVEASSYPGIAVGDRVVANSWGLSQTHHGGYAQKARLKGEWLVKIPAAFSTKDAMAIGTAGYTAMLSVLALEHGGITPQRGDILVTGANGGVGSIAIALVADLGYRVVASTGRREEADYLRSLCATEVIDRRTLSEPGAPIARERGAGAVDSVGSPTLVNVLAKTHYRGVVPACGLAQGLALPGSGLPFFLRNVTRVGI